MYTGVVTAEQWTGNKGESTETQTKHEHVEVAFLGWGGVRRQGRLGKREIKLT